MGSIPSELSLDVRPTYVPKTISDFLRELTAIDSVSDRLLRLDDFVQRLDDERRKIDAFKRELPLCMLLLNDAIATLKEESKQCRPRNVEPVLEEFIPLKKNCDENEKSEAKKEKDSGGDKMNWMSSVQLWNTDNLKNIDSKTDQKQNSVPKLREGVGEEFPLVIDDPSQSSKNKVGLRAFMPFKTCPVFPARKEDKELSVAGLSLLTLGIKNSREDVGSNVVVREQRAASATAVGSTVDDSSPPDIVLPKDKVEPLGLHIQHIPLEDGAVGPDMNSSPTETEFPLEDKVKMGPSVEHQFIPSFNGWSPPHQNNKQDRAASENLSALRAAPMRVLLFRCSWVTMSLQEKALRSPDRYMKGKMSFSLEW